MPKESKVMKDLRKYLEENGKIESPQDAIDDAIDVLYFVKALVEKEAPYALNEINTLQEAVNLIQIHLEA